MAKRCLNPSCGHIEEAADARFCGICGSELGEATMPPATDEVARKVGGAAIPIAVVVGAIIIVVIVIAAVNSSSKKGPSHAYTPPTESPSPPPVPAPEPPPPPPPAPEVRYGWITGDRVNVRNGPGVSYRSLMEVNTNDRVTIIGEAPPDNQNEGRLYNGERVSLVNGGTKTLNKGHAVTIIDTYSDKYKVSFELKNDSTTYYGYVNRSNVKLFTSDSWYNVEVSGVTGWVIDDYVRVE